MIKIIYGMTLMVVFMVVGMSIVNAATPAEIAELSGKIENYTHSHDEKSAGAKTNRFASKSEKGVDAMCLALDIQETKLTIESALTDPEFESYAAESIDLLLYHLDGTPEGERLWKLLYDETATMSDYLNTVNEIERSLESRLGGEQIWSFKVGSAMYEIFYASYYGTEAEVQTALTKMQALASEAPLYVSEDETVLLQMIAEYSYLDGLTEEDYMDIESLVGYFLEIYFGGE